MHIAHCALTIAVITCHWCIALNWLKFVIATPMKMELNFFASDCSPFSTVQKKYKMHIMVLKQHYVPACPTFCIYIFPSVGMLNIFSMCRHAQHFVCHLAMKKQHTAQDPYRPDQGFQIESQRKRYQPWWNVPMRASHSGTWMGRFHSALRVYTIATDLHTHTHTYIRGCMQGHIHPVWRTLQK